MKKTMMILMAVLAFGFYGCGEKTAKPSTAEINQPVLSAFEKPISKKEARKEAKKEKKEQDEQEEVNAQQEVQAQVQTPIKPAIPVVETQGKIQPTPLQVIEQYTKELQSLDQETRNDKNRDKKIANRVQDFFDFDRLARGSLGVNWNKINADDRKKYASLFRSLVERSYLSKSKTLVGSYDLTFEGEQVKNNEASVVCVVQKDDVDIDITYHLHRHSKGWMIYNINFDNVNLMRNYETQFNRIIAQKGFSGLIDLMEKKLKDDTTDAAL